MAPASTACGSTICGTRSSRSSPRWGVADHVLGSISGHLSRRMLEHYSHIRIDAERQALDALDAVRRSTAHNGNGNGGGANQTEIPAIVEVSDDLTSQSRHSLLLQGSPPSGKLLIPLNRRDVRVVEGARLESVCRGNSTVGSNPTLSATSFLPISEHFDENDRERNSLCHGGQTD
jgi:hypothetical protein